MTAEELKRLYEKCMSGDATPEEQRLFESYQDDFNLSEIPWAPEMGDPKEVEARLLEKMDTYLPDKKPVTHLWRYAAAAVVLIGGGLLLWNSTKYNNKAVAVAPKKEIVKPGTDKATITLSNGQIVSVDQIGEGLIATQSNISVTKNDKGQIIYQAKGSAQAAETLFNTMTTPRGGQHKLVLSDGTRVWLNAQTTLTYPVYFTGRERVVKLTGEAYFEVAHDGAKPFKVNSAGQEVQVLGTSFDIKAYSEDPIIQTTLLTGLVKLSANNNYVVLKPGQQASLEDNKGFSVNEVDPNEAIAWKNGYFLFKNEGIESVMRTIARWYDVDVSYQGDVKKRRLGGTVSRYKNLDDLLKTIELTKNVKFKLDGRRVIVMP
jgi:hypothetical protein